MANSNSDSTRKHFISSAKAKQFMGKFKEMKDKIISKEFAGKDVLPTSETFDKASIQALLDQPGCVKFRTYLGMDENLEIRMVFVGVDDKDQDLLALTEGTNDSFVAIEEGVRCPPNCPPPPPPPGG